jgi:hypothetical protein
MIEIRKTHGTIPRTVNVHVRLFLVPPGFPGVKLKVCKLGKRRLRAVACDPRARVRPDSPAGLGQVFGAEYFAQSVDLAARTKLRVVEELIDEKQKRFVRAEA